MSDDAPPGVTAEGIREALREHEERVAAGLEEEWPALTIEQAEGIKTLMSDGGRRGRSAGP